MRIPLLTGIVTILLMAIHSLFWLLIFYIPALIRLIVPISSVRRACVQLLTQIGWGWIRTNRILFHFMHPTKYYVTGTDGLDRDGWYLISSNHRSWVDVLMLLEGLDGKVPLFRFFIKRGLVLLPFFGIAFWALDMPLMRRYSKEHLAEHPEDRGKDLETTRKACAKFSKNPVALVNFLEGTRLTEAKHAEQESPYRHLLRPKAGGVAFVLAAMEGRLRSMLDVTLVYPPEKITFWKFLDGALPWMAIDVREIEIPEAVALGSYEEDPAYRERLQSWVRDLWESKDARIEEILELRSGERS